MLGLLAGRRLWLSVVLLWAVLLTQGSAKAAETQDAIARHVRAVETGLLPPVGIAGTELRGRPLRARMRALHVPGVSIAVIHDGEIAWARGFGVTRAGGPPVTPDTLFQAGSISKPVAALAVLRLVEQGALDLDRDVNSYLTSWRVPGNRFTEQAPVTLRRLLNHTAGLTVRGFPGYGSDESIPALIDSLEGRLPANTPAVRVEAVPGTAWRYSGGGYLIVQQALIDVTGTDFPALLKDMVLQPLGMTASSFAQPLPESRRAEAATPYDAKGAPIAGGAHSYPEMAAAGLWTTPTDLARFAIALQQARAGKQGAILGQKMAEAMLTPGLGQWGLGLEVGDQSGAPYFLHPGADEGFQNLMVAYEQGDGAVIMTNSDRGLALAPEILRAIARDYGWPDFQPPVRRVAAVDPAAYDRLAGRYAQSNGGMVRITRAGDKLMLIGPQGREVQLLPESELRYFHLGTSAEFVFESDMTGRVDKAAMEGRNLHMELTRLGEPHVDPTQFDLYVGRYDVGPVYSVTVSRDGDQLFLQDSDGDRHELLADDGRRFFLEDLEATITFNPEHGRAQELVWLQSGYGTTAIRRTDGKP